MLENTESQEMYLATIYALQKKNGMVRSVDVADERGYSEFHLFHKCSTLYFASQNSVLCEAVNPLIKQSAE